MFVFDHPSFDNHEAVHVVKDVASGLEAIIAVHSTTLGPSSGGVRFWSYDSYDDAIDDVLRLSHAMSYKTAMAGLELGGGKSVIIKPKGDFDRVALFESFGRAVNQISGSYIAAEDVGVSPADMKTIKTQTDFVAGLPEGENASGDPSPLTADGVYRCLKAGVSHRLKRDNVSGLTVSVQGIGHVGWALCEHLHKAGAKLIVTDINQDALTKAKAEFGAKIVEPNEIYSVDADVFAPCALGRAINPDTLPQLKVSVVAGAANNQLSTPEMGRALSRANILYCPDYVINAGGIINVASEVSGKYSATWVEGKLSELAGTMMDIFKASAKKGKATNYIADEMARKRIGRT